MMDMDVEKEKAKIFNGKTWSEAFPEVMNQRILKDGEVFDFGNCIIANIDEKMVLFKHVDGYYVKLPRWIGEKLAKYYKNGIKYGKVVRGKKQTGFGKWITTINILPCNSEGKLLKWDGQNWVEVEA